MLASSFLVSSGCQSLRRNPQASDHLSVSIQPVNSQVDQSTSLQDVFTDQPAATLSFVFADANSAVNLIDSVIEEHVTRRDFGTPDFQAQAVDYGSSRSYFDPLAYANEGNVGGDLLGDKDRQLSLTERFWNDQKYFYSPESLTLLGGGLVVGGVMANTPADDGIYRHFQSSVRGATSDEWFEALHASKELGNGMYTLPVYATAWAAGELFPDHELVKTSGKWGERSLRGFVVGAPPMFILQMLTGGSRPGETDSGSDWQLLQDNNGVSGHAFMGSLPFITAAKMTDDRGYKFLLYAGSTIAPLSRVNDGAHYPSQIALGWWMAYLAASAIDATEDPESRWRFYPYSTGNDSGLMAEFRF